MNMDFGGIILAVKEETSVKIYLSGRTKPRWTDLDSDHVLHWERLAALRLSHGENRTEVLERNPVSVPPCTLQFPDEMTSN